MAGVAQANRARREVSGSPRGSQHSHWPAQFGVIQAVAPSLRVEVSAFNKRDASEIERVVTAFARTPNGGLIVTAGGSALVHRDLIIMLAARHKLSAIYFDRAFVTARDLLSMGLIGSSCIDARPATSTASSRARSQPACRCRRRRSISLSSTSRPPRHSVYPYRRRFRQALTK